MSEAVRDNWAAQQKGLHPQAEPTHYAGLFIGVNRFTEDDTVRPLQFAVDDAVKLAHRFVVESPLVPAGHAVLALSGEPTGDQVKRSLKELLEAGVSRIEATKPRILNHLKRVADIPQRPEDLLILSISSHGFENDGTPYVMPGDGLLHFLADTAISLTAIEMKLLTSQAGKRLVFLDACRENPVVGTKGGGDMGSVSERFQRVLAQTAGQAVLTSCDVGQFSYECRTLQQGVFTHFLLRALAGEAPHDGQGLIRLDSVAKYVAEEVRSWSRRNASSEQHPWFKGPEDARAIPLATHEETVGRITATLRKLREMFVDERLTDSQWRRVKRVLTGGATDGNAEAHREICFAVAEGILGAQCIPGEVAEPSIDPGADVAGEDASSALVLDLGGGVKLELVLIPEGEFTMGSPDHEEGRSSDEGPQHNVRIAKPFYMGKTEITQAQWRALMGNEPSYFKGDDLPVEQVSWEDCREFCRKLSAKAGRTVRLPSEAEWEYACRAGTTTPFHFGATISTDQANYNGNYVYGNGRKGQYRKKTTPVGSFPANAFGLYDMHGNVWEWCADVWHANYEGAPTDGSAWTGGGVQTARVLRGGSWGFYPRYCRAADRFRNRAAARFYFGFRVAMHF